MGFQSDTNTHWQIFPKVSAVVHSRGKFHRKQTFENFHLADIKLAPLNQHCYYPSDYYTVYQAILLLNYLLLNYRDLSSKSHLADIKLAPLNQQRILNILLHTSMSQQCKLNNKHNSMSQELLVVKHLHNPPLSAMPLPPPADILKHQQHSHGLGLRSM
jgi:hypothetical protein